MARFEFVHALAERDIGNSGRDNGSGWVGSSVFDGSARGVAPFGGDLITWAG